MEPANLKFGGGAAGTFVNPLVLVVVLFVGLLILLRARKSIIMPFLMAAILIPFSQVLVLGSLHFQMLRLLALFGLVRILWAKLMKHEDIFSGGINGIDKAVIFLTIFIAVDGVLLWQESGEVIFQLGNLYTAFGVYFLLRFLIRDEEDVKRALRALAMVVAMVAVFMTYERITGNNVFYSVLGGFSASEYATAMERGDEFRATGPFGHPNLAGTFGGILFPLFMGLWWISKDDRKIAALGMAGAAAIAIDTGSSTALLGLIAGIFALFLWPVRRHMRKVRWGIVATLIGGQMYMTSPVWHIISDVDLTGNSSSYHRYMLVDQCIRHFWDWALIGTKYYANWGWDMWDLSNQYVAVADPSGLIPLICLLAIIVMACKYVGWARKAVEGERQRELFVWAFGASVFANIVAFFGISYFDQTIVAWYSILAMLCVTTAGARIAHYMAAKPASRLNGQAARGPVEAELGNRRFVATLKPRTSILRGRES
jgi:hypothetical protein